MNPRMFAALSSGMLLLALSCNQSGMQGSEGQESSSSVSNVQETSRQSSPGRSGEALIRQNSKTIPASDDDKGMVDLPKNVTGAYLVKCHTRKAPTEIDPTGQLGCGIYDGSFQRHSTEESTWSYALPIGAPNAEIREQRAVGQDDILYFITARSADEATQVMNLLDVAATFGDQEATMARANVQVMNPQAASSQTRESDRVEDEVAELGCAGTQIGAGCYFLAGVGESCVDFCKANDLTFDLALTEAVNEKDSCEEVQEALGLAPSNVSKDLIFCEDCGCHVTEDRSWVTRDVTGQALSSSHESRRVCSCQ